MLDELDLVGDLGVAQAVRREERLDLGRHRIEIAGGIVGQADEQQPGQRAQRHRPQPVAGEVEAVTHVVGEQQRAVEAVGPGVIAADEIADLAPAVGHELGAAVAADVVKGADLAIVVAQDQQLGVADAEGEDVAGLGHVRLPCHEDPVPAEDQVALGAQDGLAGIERRLERVPGAAAAQQRGEIVGHEAARETTWCAAYARGAGGR